MHHYVTAPTPSHEPLYGSESFTSQQQSVRWVIIMEPEYLLSCSLEPATGPYYEPDDSSSHFHNIFDLRFILILSVFPVITVGLASRARYGETQFISALERSVSFQIGLFPVQKML